MKHVLIIGGWTENYEAALRLGYRVTGFAAINQRTLLSNDVLAQCEFWDVDASDVPQALLCAMQLNRAAPISGVFSFTEKGLETAAVIASVLGVPGNELDGNVRTRNKQLTRTAMAGTALDNVAWRVAYGESDVVAFFESHGPLVIKPMNGVGSEGVNVIRDAQALRTDLGKRAFPVLVEAYIEGSEYSVETISLAGEHSVLAVTQKTLTDNLVEMQHLMPAPIGSDEQLALEQAVVLLLSTMGIRNSVAHSEFRLNRDEAGRLHVYLIETQLRTGGGRIWKLLELCRGIDVFSVLIGGVVDSAHDLPTLTAPRPCLAYFPRFGQGIVHHIEGLADVAAAPGVEFVDLEISEGKPTNAYVSSATRNGSIIVSASNHTELLTRRDEALAMLRVTVDPA
ncbi:Dapdiamide A synthase [Pandoraea horticolens]|uniref:Dapdiamide A synthase n=1 Tax=Pandoraea horticolens TaxID=2508298 RepID=A0A5E4ZBZ2_9BURK|nr:ATP-grasp domain-containing protein [Pandoraea horticolens]VVE58901.1 Dapdiamide A synthase [Pandoraea horticolens]